MPPFATNIDAPGRRRRYLIGAVALALGATATAVLVWRGVDTGWRLALIVPFWMAGLGFFQARAGT